MSDKEALKQEQLSDHKQTSKQELDTHDDNTQELSPQEGTKQEVSIQKRENLGATGQGNVKKENGRTKFSNWLKCIDALNHTKTALHDYTLIKWKKEIHSWKLGEHIPNFLRCVSKNRITKKDTQGKRGDRNWFCKCEHPQCDKILEKIIGLHTNPGRMVWKTVLCIKINSDDFKFQPNVAHEEQTNIPRYEPSGLRRFWEILVQLSSIVLFRKEKEEIIFEDIFKDCKQEHVWCIANMFMNHGNKTVDIMNTSPSDTDASMFFKMMHNCKLFDLDLELYENLRKCRNQLHHSATNRLSKIEAESYIKKMIEFLEQFEQPLSCKQYWDSRTNLNQILKETILSVYIPDNELQDLKQQAISLKEEALKVDAETDKASGLVIKETIDLLEKTTREKQNTIQEQMCDTQAVKSFNEVEVKDTGKHFVNMANLVERHDKNEELMDALAQEVLPRIHQIIGDAAKDDDDIKESLEEVYDMEVSDNSIVSYRRETTDTDFGEVDNNKKDLGTLGSDQRDSNDTNLSSISGEMDSNLLRGYKQQFTVEVTDPRTRNDFYTFCRTSSEEIVMAERVNQKLKKLDIGYNVIESLDLNDWPFDICSIGNDECVVAFPGRKLQFVRVKEIMELSTTVVIDHDCTGIAFFSGQLYIADAKSVYQYSLDGVMSRCVFTNSSPHSLFRQIAISSDGSKIYVANFESGLITLDLTAQDASPVALILKNAQGVSVDDEGNVLMCGCHSGTVTKISPDGKKELGVISVANDNDVDNTALYYDIQNKAILTSGSQGDLVVYKLQNLNQ